jgi:hypothetical protein
VRVKKMQYYKKPMEILKICRKNLKNTQKTGKVRVRNEEQFLEIIKFQSKREIMILKRYRFGKRVMSLMKLAIKNTVHSPEVSVFLVNPKLNNKIWVSSYKKRESNLN